MRPNFSRHVIGHSFWRLVSFVIVSIGALVPGTHAQNLQRVALIQVSGTQGQSIKEALRSNLASQPGIAMVSDAELSNAARTLNLDHVDGPYTGTDLPKLSQSLGISAFIEGDVTHRRREWRLDVTVRNSVGDVSGEARWKGRTLAALEQVRQNGYSKLAGYLTQAMQSSASLGGAETESSTNGGAWWQSSSGEEPPPSGPVQDFHALRINVLGGSLYRSMKTLVLTSFALSRPLEERFYKSQIPGHMEVGLEAEFYPFALPIKSLPDFPYLGIVTSFRYGLLLNGTACEVLSVPGAPCDAGDQKEIQTTQWEFLGALRGRYRFGKSRFDPEIQLDAGFGMFTFAFDMNDLLELSGLNPAAVVPPMRYRYLHIAAGGSYGVYPPYLTLGIRAAIRPGFGVGGDALKVWGTGDASGPDRPQGYSFEIEARSEADYIVRGLHFGLRLQYFMFQTRFSGQPTCEDPSPPCTFGEPWLPWPVNAQTGEIGGLLEPVNDHYFRASLMVGYTWPPGP